MRAGTVYSIAVQSDGKVLAGGAFTSIGGQTRFRIARLDAATGLADSFDPNANNNVYSIAMQPDGKILVGGNFTVHRRTVAQSLRPIVERHRRALDADGDENHAHADPRRFGAAVRAASSSSNRSMMAPTYTLLGTATAAPPASYTLTGQNLPADKTSSSAPAASIARATSTARKAPRIKCRLRF